MTFWRVANRPDQGKMSPVNRSDVHRERSDAPRVAIVGYPGHAMVSRLYAELQRRGRDVTLVTPDAVVTEVRDEAVLVRPFCDQPPYAFVLLTVSTDHIAALQGVSALARSGVRVANSAPAVMRAADKFATAEVLARAGVRVPRTVSVCTTRAAEAEARRMGYPVVLKAADGSEGGQVSLVNDAQHLATEIERIRASLGLAPSVNSPLVLQPVVGSTLGRDRRLFVVSGAVQGAMDRVARAGEWRSNLSWGATPVAAEATSEEVAMAVAAADALGLDFGTVDLIHDEHGPVVIEANPFGDILDVGMVSGLDLVGSLADLVDTRAGIRHGEPIVARPLRSAERSALSDFCWDRLRRRIENLEATQPVRTSVPESGGTRQPWGPISDITTYPGDGDHTVPLQHGNPKATATSRGWDTLSRTSTTKLNTSSGG